MQKNITRGELLKGTGAAAALGLAAAGMVGAQTAQAADADDVAWDMNADLVVVGAGMGGLTAGVQALEDGIENVVIVEISKWVGGGSSFSNGSIHVGSAGTTRDSYQKFSHYQSNTELALASFDACAPLQEWLDQFDLPLEIEAAGEGSSNGISTHDASASRAYMVTEDGERGVKACVNFFEEYAALFEDMGGTLLRQTAGKKLFMDDDNKVCGILCSDASGNPLKIATTQVVLACGGWQGNQELRNRYLGIDGYGAANMGTPYNTGAGIKMATEVGAALNGDMSHFAGLFVAAEPAKNWMDDVETWEACGYDDEEGGKWWLFNFIVDAIPKAGILVNCYGERFADENAAGHSTEPDIARQRRATAVMICDSTAYDAWVESGVRGTVANMGEKLDLITSDKIGGSLYKADTLEELADAMNASGIATHSMHKANLVKTVAEYNAAAEAGTGADLPVARVTMTCDPIVTPPFYAFPMRNAIFVNFGGVEIDTKARVLDTQHQPIPGLYATSPCAGGMMHEYYCGSIAHAGATGRWAADSAAEALGISL